MAMSLTYTTANHNKTWYTHTFNEHTKRIIVKNNKHPHAIHLGSSETGRCRAMNLGKDNYIIEAQYVAIQ